MPSLSSGDVIIEFIQHGRFVKVTAIDPNTGIEASIVGDPNAPQEKLKQLAAQKLNYVIEKRANS